MIEQLSLAPEAPVKARNLKVPLRRIEVEGATLADVDRDLVASIKEMGVLESVILEARGDGFSVIDGRRRTLAAIAAGLKSIPARVIEIDGWLGRDVLSILLNEQRGPNPVSELLAIERLIQAGKSEREITKATGMDAATIRKRLKLTRLIFALRIRLENGLLKPSLAEAIAVLPEAVQEQLAGRIAVTGKLSGGDLREVRQARLEEAVAPLSDVLAQTAATTEAAPETWQVAVLRLLGQAINAIPNDEGWAWSPLVTVVEQLQAVQAEMYSEEAV